MWLSHERLGYNYRMDELSAALGVAQMSRIEEIIAIPFHNHLTAEEIDYVACVLERALGEM